jgi:uncharacterized protein YcfJ
MLHSSKSVRVALLAGGVAALTALPAVAYEAWAPVTSKRPIYAEINDPTQQCWTEQVTGHETMRIDQAPIGVRGRVVEQPGGNDLVVVPRTREVQRCRTVDNSQMQLQGYEVHYVYDGHEYVTRLSYDPGSRIRVNVDINTAQPY